MSQLSQMKCEACRPDAPKVTVEQIEEYSPAIPDYKIIYEDNLNKLKRIYNTVNYAESLKLVNDIAQYAESVAHHPVIIFEFRQVSVLWWSHKMGGLHVNDFICAANCDQIYEKIKA